MLATLYNIFQDEIGLSQFGLANADLHFRQDAAISSRTGATLVYYILDPIPPGGEERENWLRVHQESHTQVNSILGIAGNDLTDVDFKSPDQLAAWIWLHAQEHFQASNILGLT